MVGILGRCLIRQYCVNKAPMTGLGNEKEQRSEVDTWKRKRFESNKRIPTTKTRQKTTVICSLICISS